jgi:hypothetical protein
VGIGVVDHEKEWLVAIAHKFTGDLGRLAHIAVSEADGLHTAWVTGLGEAGPLAGQAI